MKKTAILGSILALFAMNFDFKLSAATVNYEAQNCDGKSANCCNRKTNLCNRPYNKIAQINVHNATTNDKTGLIIPKVKPCWKGLCDYNTGINPVADQRWDLGEQLDHGLRYFKLPIHPGGRDNVPWVTHTIQTSGIDDIIKDKIEPKIKDISFGSSYVRSKMMSVVDKIANNIKNNIWEIDTTNRKFSEVLDQLKNFLDQNPHEVITLELNTFDLDKFHMKHDLLNDFNQSGIMKYLFKPKNGAWPTLGEMIKNNQRLVVFIDDYINEPGFLYSNNYTTRNGWGFEKVEELTSGEDCAKANNHDPNVLFNMTHNLTGKVSGSPALAEQANRYEVLDEHIKKCRAKVGRYPNFISMDFIDEHFDDIQKKINELNNTNW